MHSFAWILKALVSHYWCRPWQTLFLASGLICGVGLWSAVQIINQQAEDSYLDARRLLGSQADFWVQDRRGLGIPQDLYLDIRRAGVLQVFPVLELEVSTQAGDMIQVLATDLMVVPGDGAFASENPIQSSADWLGFIQPPFQAWYPAQLAAELELLPGDQLDLRDGRQMPPAFIREGGEQGRRVLIDMAAALALDQRQSFSYLAVGRLNPEQQQTLLSLLPAGIELIENRQHLDLKQLTQSLHTHLDAMSLLSFAVGLFIVFNAVRFSLWHRRRTLLNLRLAGCTVGELSVAIAVETLLWSLIGALAGFFLGIVLAQFLLPGVGASLQGLYGASVQAVIEASPTTFWLAWLITLSGLIWALFWPLFLQARRRVLQSGSDELAAEDSKRSSRHLFFIALILAVFAALFYPLIDSSIDGFVMLGLVLLAAALALPQLMSWLSAFMTRLVNNRGLLARWVLADGYSQLPVLRSSMMALLLALIANVGVGVLVDSFRIAFTDWLTLRQSADIYLRSSEVDYRQIVEYGESEGWLRDSHQRSGVSLHWRDKPARARGVEADAPDSLQIPLSDWLGESPNDALADWRSSDDAVLINEQVKFLAGVSVGELIEIPTDRGLQSFRVVGVFYDYGNPYYQFYLPDEVFKRLWTYYYDSGIAFWLDLSNPGALEAAESVMRQQGANRGDWISQQEIRRLSVGIFDRTFAITAVMNSLTLLVAVIALLASLLAMLHQRMPQFAQWRALGVSQSELVVLVMLPLLLFCGFTWLVSIPIGSLLGWILIDKMNVVSFGWSMPLHWDFTPMLQLGGAVLIIVVFSSAVLALFWRRHLARSLAALGEVV